MNKLALLREELQNLKRAADFLGFSLDRSRELVNCENWSPEELERLESLASRFARLTDLLTQRVMRLVDAVELTPEGTLLDRFHRAEKRGWVDNSRDLVRIRELRNLIAHEYAADRMIEIYQAVAMLTPELLRMVPLVAAYADKLMQKYSG